LTNEEIITAIIAREGGFVDDPLGGPTKYGIRISTLSQWRHRPATRDDVLNLSLFEAHAIIRTLYLAPFFVMPSQDLRAFMADSAVNHGVRGAIRLLQGVLKVKQDGVLGPKTMAALSSMPARQVLAEAVADRVRLYGRIVAQHPGDLTFLEGWLNRAAEFIEELA
jgi:lysozyme family protein